MADALGDRAERLVEDLAAAHEQLSAELRAAGHAPAAPVLAPLEGSMSVDGRAPSRVASRGMERHRDESDQLPEDAPPEQIRRDEDEREGARDEAQESAGVPNEQGQATGDPGSAG